MWNFFTLILISLISNRLVEADNTCCSECPLYQGLLIEPGCQECTKNIYVRLGEEIELKCAPCNSTFAKQINQSRNANFFWTFWHPEHKTVTIREELTTKAKSLARIRSDELLHGTLNCFFGPENNSSKAKIQGHKNFIVCGSLIEPDFTCFTYFEDRLRTLAMKCLWKIPADTALSYGETKKECRYDYGTAYLKYDLYGKKYNESILLEKRGQACGFDQECVTELFCARNECRNGRLSHYLMFSNSSSIVIEAKSLAEGAKTFEFKVQPARTIFRHNSPPYLISSATTADSCTVAINGSIDSILMKNASFAVSIKVTDRKSREIVRDDTRISAIPERKPQVRVVVDNLDPDRLYDLYAKYNLVESVYSSDVTHLECQTRRAAPAVTPKIPRGGYMILEDQLILYLDQIPEEKYGAPGFQFLATLSYNGTQQTKSQLKSPISFNTSIDGPFEIQLRCKNSEGMCAGSTLLRVEADTRLLKSKYVVARRQNSEGYPGVTQYYLSWSPVPNVTEYILNWCQDSASCDENRFETWRFPGSQDNALICIPKDKVMFYVSVCRGDQCGPMASAKLDIGYDRPKKLVPSAPVLDKATKALRLTWKAPESEELTGFAISLFQYTLDGREVLTTADKELLVPCEQIQAGQASMFWIQHLVEARPVNRLSPASCSGSSIFDKPLLSEWSDNMTLTAEMCSLGGGVGSSVTIFVAVVFVMSAASLLGLGCIAYYRFQAKMKRFVQRMMNVVDQVEQIYAERKAAKEDQEKLVERWIHETFGGPPEYTILHTPEGDYKFPILPTVDQGHPIRKYRHAKSEESTASLGTIEGGVYVKQLLGASVSTTPGSGATGSSAVSEQFTFTQGTGGSDGTENSAESSALISAVDDDSSQMSSGQSVPDWYKQRRMK